jgi:hypothetical protein
MRQGRVVPLDDALALEAARHSVAHRATLWTQDAGFIDQQDVRYLAKA